MKLIELTENFMNETQKSGKLNADIFLKLAKSIPKEERQSFDQLTVILLSLFKDCNL